MLEELLALAMLSEIKLTDSSLFLEKLDTYFEQYPEDTLLLELEFFYKDTHASINKIINEYFINLNCDRFGKSLFYNVQTVYLLNQFSIDAFSQKMYVLWNLYLPFPLREEEPFWTLCCAGDCLSYGDETQTRALYEKAFSFFT